MSSITEKWGGLGSVSQNERQIKDRPSSTKVTEKEKKEPFEIVFGQGFFLNNPIFSLITGKALKQMPEYVQVLLKDSGREPVRGFQLLSFLVLCILSCIGMLTFVQVKNSDINVVISLVYLVAVLIFAHLFCFIAPFIFGKVSSLATDHTPISNKPDEVDAQVTPSTNTRDWEMLSQLTQLVSGNEHAESVRTSSERLVTRKELDKQCKGNPLTLPLYDRCRYALDLKWEMAVANRENGYKNIQMGIDLLNSISHDVQGIKGTEVYPILGMLSYNRGIFAGVLGRDDEGAESYYKEALKRDPSLQKARNNLCMTRLRLDKDLDKALADIKICREHARFEPTFIDTEGQISYKLALSKHGIERETLLLNSETLLERAIKRVKEEEDHGTKIVYTRLINAANETLIKVKEELTKYAKQE